MTAVNHRQEHGLGEHWWCDVRWCDAGMLERCAPRATRVPPPRRSLWVIGAADASTGSGAAPLGFRHPNRGVRCLLCGATHSAV